MHAVELSEGCSLLKASGEFQTWAWLVGGRVWRGKSKKVQERERGEEDGEGAAYTTHYQRMSYVATIKKQTHLPSLSPPASP